MDLEPTRSESMVGSGSLEVIQSMEEELEEAGTGRSPAVEAEGVSDVLRVWTEVCGCLKSNADPLYIPF